MPRRPARPRRTTSPPSAPLWIITYSDMVTVLLGFFILLAALSEIKRPERYDQAAAEIQSSFGLPAARPTFGEHLRRLEVQTTPPPEEEGRESAGAIGVAAGDAAVARTGEGYLFTRGGLITFEPGSADLSDEARRNLRQIAAWLRGYNNMVEVRGYAAAMEAAMGPEKPASPEGSDGRAHLSGHAGEVTTSPGAGPSGASGTDLWALSYARARAVMEVLTAGEDGVRPAQVRLIANADHEPRVKRVYGSKAQEPNRRVEVLVTDTLIDETGRPEHR